MVKKTEQKIVQHKRDFCVKPGMLLYVMCTFCILADCVALHDIIVEGDRYYVLPFPIVCVVTGFYLKHIFFTRIYVSTKNIRIHLLPWDRRIYTFDEIIVRIDDRDRFVGCDEITLMDSKGKIVTIGSYFINHDKLKKRLCRKCQVTHLS